MSEVAEARAQLTGYATELDSLSQDLAALERILRPVEQTYNDAVDDFIAGLYERWESGESKWPSEDVRLKLARRSLDRELRDRYDALRASRERIRKRISDLKTSVEAQRSILSALKVELEATA